jgi:hypothetical protein
MAEELGIDTSHEVSPYSNIPISQTAIKVYSVSVRGPSGGCGGPIIVAHIAEKLSKSKSLAVPCGPLGRKS